ncbi:MAG: hypothetical protein M3177_09560 [Pseudomonadota bacterium]|nr:hypothetical protein [Pseudomonadota bacterium]
MIYEARHSPGLNWSLAAACALLSLLGFAAAGVIPTQSGSEPLVGWAIVAACFLAAAVFVKRALERSPQARVDEKGVWSRRGGADPVPWAEIERVDVIRAGIQRIARFGRAGGKEFGINTTFYDRGIADLLAAVRHHRPDLTA